MDEDREERIRTRAYALWQSEGAPDGRHADHWETATREVDGGTGIREGHDAGDDAALAADPENEDAKLDVGLDESFPASDPPAQTVPRKTARKRTVSK